MGGKVYFTAAQDLNNSEQLYVYDPGTGQSTSLTNPNQYSDLDDLSVDKLGKKYLVLAYYAVDGLGNRSDPVTQEYRIDPDAPQVTINPGAGTYHNDVSVTFDVYDETEAFLYYTLNGADPTQSSTRHEYDGIPILLSETTTVKYFAFILYPFYPLSVLKDGL